jgi:hypothetical protein
MANKKSYQTLIKALGNIKGGSVYEKIRRLLIVYDAYSAPFNKINAELLFDDIPEEFNWNTHTKFTYNGQSYTPVTIADFLSVMSAMSLNLTPREGSFFLVFRNA